MAQEEEKNKKVYPVTPETIHKYAASIFGPIKKGENVATIWVPMAGRRKWNKFIIGNIELFKNELPDYQQYLLVYIEPLDLTEGSLSGYLRLMGNSFLTVCREMGVCRESPEFEVFQKIFEDSSSSYSKLLQTLKDLLGKVVQAGNKVVIFLGEFDELSFVDHVFLNNLKSLWSSLESKLLYVFLTRSNIGSPEKVAGYGDFNEVILQNIVLVPILEKEDTKYLIDCLCQVLSCKISKEEAEIVEKLCGGHPYLLKAALRIVNKLDGERIKLEKLEELLINHYELRSVAKGILDVLDEKTKIVFKKIAKGEKVESYERESLEVPEKLGLISKQSEDTYRFFGQLFYQVVLKGDEKGRIIEGGGRGLGMEEKSGLITFNGQTIEEKFTSQEYSLLRMFMSKANKLCTRDNISETLWGKESFEKYSNWAIDQIISKLRKKLRAMGVKDGLITVRGRGYKFIS